MKLTKLKYLFFELGRAPPFMNELPLIDLLWFVSDGSGLKQDHNQNWNPCSKLEVLAILLWQFSMPRR